MHKYKWYSIWHLWIFSKTIELNARIFITKFGVFVFIYIRFGLSPFSNLITLTRWHRKMHLKFVIRHRTSGNKICKKNWGYAYKTVIDTTQTDTDTHKNKLVSILPLFYIFWVFLQFFLFCLKIVHFINIYFATVHLAVLVLLFFCIYYFRLFSLFLQ